MSTVINTPGQQSGDSSGGWAVAVIILLIVIAGGAFLWVRYHPGAAAPAPGANINVTLPAGSSGADSGGAAQ